MYWEPALSLAPATYRHGARTSCRPTALGPRLKKNRQAGQETACPARLVGRRLERVHAYRGHRRGLYHEAVGRRVSNL